MDSFPLYLGLYIEASTPNTHLMLGEAHIQFEYEETQNFHPCWDLNPGCPVTSLTVNLAFGGSILLPSGARGSVVGWDTMLQTGR
jgi:hypothetical protein